MRISRLIVLPIMLLMVGITAADARMLQPHEARRFVAGKLFAYTCFDGTRGLGRIYSDGSVSGTIRKRGGRSRFIAMPRGTIRVTRTSICAALRGAAFQPCFNVVKTSRVSFRGSLSGFGFAYCDFVRRYPRKKRASPEKPVVKATPIKATPIAATPKPTPLQSAVMSMPPSMIP